MAVRWRAVLRLQDHSRPEVRLMLRDRRSDAEADAQKVKELVDKNNGHFWVWTEDGRARVYDGNVMSYRIERVYTHKHFGIEVAARRLLNQIANQEMDNGNLPIPVVEAMDALHRAIEGDDS